MHLLLARFDDHVAYYTLGRIFLERHGVVIPRQQMVQWTGHVAFLVQALVRQMFERMMQRGYLQMDETPVKVMDPEVKGKCARHDLRQKEARPIRESLKEAAEDLQPLLLPQSSLGKAVSYLLNESPR